MSHPTTDGSILPRGSRGRARLLRFGGVPLVTTLAVLTLAACGGDDADGTAAAPVTSVADTAARPAFGLVTPEQAASLAADGAITVIDVRTPEEFAEGHLDGALLVDLSSPTFADEVAQLDPLQPYLVYCRSGNRSGQAVDAMQGLGFEQLWDMDGGVIAWTSAGLPLVS
jgi:rhodanese-related sulfurtransferase